jgi:hypothetical protein
MMAQEVRACRTRSLRRSMTYGAISPVLEQ